MLSSQLSGAYRQYKQDTDSVAAWLASTAKSCGYPAQLLGSKTCNAAPQATGRLKGKARKQAKIAPNASVAPKDKPYLVALDDFTRLATFIAGYKNGSIKVPGAFSKTLDRVIAVRSGFGGKMRQQGAEPDSQSDAKHGYFVRILEAVRDTLRPCMSTVDVARAPKEKDNQESSQDMANRFATLSVDEPSESFLSSFGSRSEERPKQQAGDNITYEADSSSSRDEAWFAFLLLINDLTQIRNRIMWIWSNSHSTGFDPAVAGVASNTAISIARGLIDDFAPLISKFQNGLGDLINAHYYTGYVEKGYTNEECLDIGGSGFRNEAYDIANTSCIIPFCILQQFSSQLGGKGLFVPEPGKFGYYDPTSNRAAKSGEEKVHEDRAVLSEFLAEIMVVVRKIPNYPVKDEFLIGMQELEKTRKISLSLVFAAQVFLDIHHTMRNATHQSCERVLKETHMMHSYIRSYFDLHKGSKKDTQSSNFNMLQSVAHNLELMNADPVYQTRATLYAMQGEQIPDRMKAHRILILSPILSGLYLFYCRSHMYKVGLNAANSWRTIVSCAHLYNALCQEGLAPRRWTDMNVAFSLLGESGFWVGGERPRGALEYYQKFHLMMGLSATVFAKGRRHSTSQMSRGGHRSFKMGLPVSSMFFNAVTEVQSDIAWTGELVQEIASRSRHNFEWVDIGDGYRTMKRIEPAPDPERKAITSKNKQDKANNRNGANQGGESEQDKISPGSFIQSLCLALQNEVIEMSFPYLRLHCQCWATLQNLKSCYDTFLGSKYGPSNMGNDSPLPYLIAQFFSIAGGIETGEPDKSGLETPAIVINTLINTGAGKICVNDLETFGFTFGTPEKFKEGHQIEDSLG